MNGAEEEGIVDEFSYDTFFKSAEGREPEAERT